MLYSIVIILHVVSISVTGGLPTGAIIGIVVGGSLGLALLIFVPITVLVWIRFYKRNKRRAARSEEHGHSSKAVDDPTYGHVDL